MEGFIQNLPKAETFPLSVFDLPGSPTNISYVFFYENTARQHDFMPSIHIKESLARTLESFPILLGHLRSTARCAVQIDVNPQTLNIPNFLESRDDGVSFSDLKEAKFAWGTWPENVATVTSFAMPAADGEIRLLNVHVLRLKDNTGLVLFVSCPHYTFDGAGYFTFVKQWARTMAAMSSKQVMEATPDLCHDRSRIPNYMSTERRPLDPQSNAIYTTSNFICDSLTWLSPTMLGRLLGKLGGLSSGEAHLFHINQDTLDKLRSQVTSHLPAGGRLSDNDLLVALVSRTYVQSQEQPVPKAGWFTAAPEPETHFTIHIPCDARQVVGFKEKYTGNFLMRMLVREPMDDLIRATTPETVAQSALNIRTTLKTLTPSLVSEFRTVVTQHPTAYMRPMAFAASHKTTSMLTTSLVKFGLYDTDFGSGKPKFVSLPPSFAGSYTVAAFLPPPEGVDGVYVLMTTNTEAMGRVLENEAWREISTCVW